MTQIDFELLTEIDEYKAIIDLSDRAKLFLESQSWCNSIKKCWFDFGIYDKIAVFLFQIEPINDSVDEFIWVIEGDLPTVYLDQSIQTGKEALKVYCELMSDWYENILNKRSISDCYPVSTAPTEENANLLKTRIEFIRRELLTIDKK